MTSTLAIATLIHQNSPWLGSHLTKLADEALAAFEKANYTEAVVRAGACLEGLLKLILGQWGVTTEAQPTLGPLIGAVRDSKKAPRELLERFNEANTIRNRAPHDKAVPKLSEVTEGDALQIINILALVVDWYRAEFHPREAGVAPGLLPIFFSVGGPHRLNQQLFLRHLRGELEELGVKLRALTPGEYSQEKPFDQIHEVMSTCRGALIVGLERSHAYAVFEREKSDREKLYQDQYIPTAWNQIEASMASALRLPILVLRERRLHREGIFEAENHRHRIRDFDLEVESKGLTSELREFLAGWVKHVSAILPGSGEDGHTDISC